MNKQLKKSPLLLCFLFFLWVSSSLAIEPSPALLGDELQRLKSEVVMLKNELSSLQGEYKTIRTIEMSLDSIAKRLGILSNLFPQLVIPEPSPPDQGTLDYKDLASQDLIKEIVTAMNKKWLDAEKIDIIKIGTVGKKLKSEQVKLLLEGIGNDENKLKVFRLLNGSIVDPTKRFLLLDSFEYSSSQSRIKQIIANE